MEFVNGVKEKRVLDIREVLEGEYEGKEIRMNGAVHTIRHMGEVAFVILRKSRGLVQCVYEAGGTDFDIRDLKEESAVEVMGVVKAEERAPFCLMPSVPLWALYSVPPPQPHSLRALPALRKAEEPDSHP